MDHPKDHSLLGLGLPGSSFHLDIYIGGWDGCALGVCWGSLKHRNFSPQTSGIGGKLFRTCSNTLKTNVLVVHWETSSISNDC